MKFNTLKEAIQFRIIESEENYWVDYNEYVKSIEEIGYAKIVLLNKIVAVFPDFNQKRTFIDAESRIEE
ncbi:MAG: hypothetical protein IJF80_04315 [Clostridia bacterium]|nr:hypothetical protein [Clostridia bacterium]